MRSPAVRVCFAAAAALALAACGGSGDGGGATEFPHGLKKELLHTLDIMSSGGSLDAELTERSYQHLAKTYGEGALLAEAERISKSHSKLSAAALVLIKGHLDEVAWEKLASSVLEEEDIEVLRRGQVPTLEGEEGGDVPIDSPLKRFGGD